MMMMIPDDDDDEEEIGAFGSLRKNCWCLFLFFSFFDAASDEPGPPSALHGWIPHFVRRICPRLWIPSEERLHRSRQLPCSIFCSALAQLAGSVVMRN